jgi:hypothetical protein
MIVLDATTKSLTVTMSGAPATTNPDFVVAWSDDTGSAFTEGSTDGALNGTSQVTLVAAPAASTRRLVKTVYIENKDTAAVTLTITYNNNATLRNIAKVTLAVGDTWSTDGTTDTNGNLKTIQGSVSLTTGVTGTLPVANGGTNLSSGTSGGVLAYTASGTLASSAALTQYCVVYGGGAGVAPSATSAGTATYVLTSNGSGAAPTFQASSGVTTGKAIAMAIVFS